MVDSYSFNHRAGPIHMQRRADGRWIIVFGGECSLSCATLQDAITRIRKRRSGLASWDELADAAEAPSTVADWFPVRVHE